MQRIKFKDLSGSLLMIITSILLVITVFNISGCKTELGNKLVQHRKNYCDKTSSSVLKAAAIKAIQLKLPAYPKEGICTDLGLLHMQTADKAIEVEVLQDN
jgi:uncharacterized protein YxeA